MVEQQMVELERQKSVAKHIFVVQRLAEQQMVEQAYYQGKDAKKTFPLGASHPRRRIHKKTRDWLRPAKKRRFISPEKSRSVYLSLIHITCFLLPSYM
jgi:hypothetical protein